MSKACSPVSGWEMSKIVDLDPKSGGVLWVHGMFGIDIGTDTTELLSFGYDV
jgi:hypothetical protein